MRVVVVLRKTEFLWGFDDFVNFPGLALNFWVLSDLVFVLFCSGVELSIWRFLEISFRWFRWFAF